MAVVLERGCKIPLVIESLRKYTSDQISQQGLAEASQHAVGERTANGNKPIVVTN